eukprot:2448790-Amphidinium_carterae.1
MPRSGSAPAKRFVSMVKSKTSLRARLRPLSGSTPVKLFAAIENICKACIARMPPSGSVPAK